MTTDTVVDRISESEVKMTEIILRKIALKAMAGLWSWVCGHICVKEQGVRSNFGVVRPERNKIPAVGLGGAVSPQWVQGSASVGVQGAKPPKASQISHFRTYDILSSLKKTLAFWSNKSNLKQSKFPP